MTTTNHPARRGSILGSALAVALTVVSASPAEAVSARSSTVAVSPDGATVWVVNSDANSVSVVDALTTAVLAETPVGRQPRSLAITPGGAKVYVACLAENRVDVLDGSTFAVVRSIAVGREPFGVAVAPDGARAYVANTATDTVSVINTATDTVVATIGAGDRPRAVAVSPDSATVAVTNFLTPTPSLNGTVQLIDAATLAVRAVVNLPTLAGPLNGVPNLIQGASFRPGTPQVWLPLVASVTGAANLTLQNTVHPHVAIVDSAQLPPREIPGTRTDLNAVVVNPAVSQPTAVDFSPAGGIALVVNMASNDVTLLDAATRAEIRTVPVGSAPSGVAVSGDGGRAYVVNDLSRTLSIIDMTVPANAAVVGTVAVTQETLPPNVANGKKLFFTSRGRMSTQNFVACISCHPDGGHDARTWIFTNNVDEGIRKTTDIRGMVDSGAIHWTANMDEPQDLEWNVRNINFGPGLVDGTPADALASESNAGRAQDLDDLAAFLDSLIAPVRGNPNRAPGGGLTAAAARGKQLFMDGRRGCRSCHFGSAGTDSDRNSLVRHDVGTLAANDVNGQQGFDTMGLRNLYDAAPYLHDGTAPALQAVITNRNLNDRHGLTSDLTPPQQSDLVAFLLGFGTDRDELAAGAGVGLPSAIRVPIRVRDVAFTALDADDARPFNRISGFSLSLAFPTTGIVGVTVAPAGIAAALVPTTVTDPPADLANGRKAYTVSFGTALPLVPERAGGQVVAVATFTLTPGSSGSFAIALESAGAALRGGPGASFEKSESVADENLFLTNGVATVGTPEISAVEIGSPPLTMSKLPATGFLEFAWEGTVGVSYDLYAGSLAAIRVGIYDHSCLASSLDTTGVELPPGTADAYYLVGAKSTAFGVGSLGLRSAGVERPNPSPCP